ncbi:hypothetical protein GGR95_000297 [Sulfitobacter undariae]|uniref:SH3b domain-containing protein n=1 Tax=Sulfitobacter undariae TaxID=1563671 RepID=A0A7W6E0W2_9RHOB|nr:SH3 domain-containing protein [Sulfitobacter undariae]MBB3992678.1 hypothetical protein [Sulfitobacter undariae]
MKTFILLTFGFLTFAFYQLSGGADFEPASAQIAEETEAPAVQTRPVVEPVIAAAAIDTAVIAALEDSDATVTRVSMDLTNVEAAAATQQTQPSSTAQIIDSSDTPQIILPSLIATTNTSAPAANDSNVRLVSGNRVNVRGGPSTDYGVISRLNRGDEVRILEDNGNGWVLMQPLDGGESGWMADFLLTSG